MENNNFETLEKSSIYKKVRYIISFTEQERIELYIFFPNENIGACYAPTIENCLWNVDGKFLNKEEAKKVILIRLEKKAKQIINQYYKDKKMKI